jgi:hypothetical protein
MWNVAFLCCAECRVFYYNAECHNALCCYARVLHFYCYATSLYAECQSGEYCIFIVTLIVAFFIVMLSVIMLSVIMLSAVMLECDIFIVMLSALMLNVVVLECCIFIVMLRLFMLNVIVLSIAFLMLC